MDVTLNLSSDILSLYIPFSGPNKRIENTRSVLLQKQENGCFTIIGNLTFVLVVSMHKTIPVDYLLRYMLMTYARSAYSSNSKQSDKIKHASLFSAPILPTSTEEPQPVEFIDSNLKNFIRLSDTQNTKDYAYVMQNKLFQAEGWQWYTAGELAIADVNYRQMRNINFIRGVKQVSISCNGDKRFKDDAQYSILLDNHQILYFFLNHFKRGKVTLEHKEVKSDYTLTILDPTQVKGRGNKHEPYEGGNYLYYIEKQLNHEEHRDFRLDLRFKQTYVCTGGLLCPSVPENNDTICLHEVNNVESMENNTIHEDNTGQRLTKKQQAIGVRFRPRYNRFYVDLSVANQTHVSYPEREQMLVREPEQPTPKTGKLKAAPPKPVKLSKNQPTLATVVSNIPENAKRKREEEQEEPKLTKPVAEVKAKKIRPTKKLRVSPVRIDSFFKSDKVT